MSNIWHKPLDDLNEAVSIVGWCQIETPYDPEVNCHSERSQAAHGCADIRTLPPLGSSTWTIAAISMNLDKYCSLKFLAVPFRCCV